MTPTDKAAEEAADKAFRWVRVENKDEMQAFYLSIIERVREAAMSCGYAIGVHGSMRRDLDLIAVPWRDGCADKDTLAVAIHTAACGIQRQSYQWEEKPLGRVATSFPVCFPTWDGNWNEPNIGHIDLSVMPSRDAEIEALKAEVRAWTETALSFQESKNAWAHSSCTLRAQLAQAEAELQTLRKIAGLCKEEIDHGFDLPSEVFDMTEIYYAKFRATEGKTS